MKWILSLLLLIPVVSNATSSVNNAVYTLTTASVSTSALVLAANSSRRYLLIQNNGSQTVYVKFGSTISGTEGIALAAGGSYEAIIPSSAAVYMKAASGTQSLTVYEGN